MNVVLKCFFEYKREMGTLGAVTIMVFTVVIYPGHRHVKHPFGFLYLLTDLWQVTYFERRAILLHQIHCTDVMEIQLVVYHLKLFLREIKSLFYQVDVFVLHVFVCWLLVSGFWLLVSGFWFLVAVHSSQFTVFHKP